MGSRWRLSRHVIRLDQRSGTIQVNGIELASDVGKRSWVGLLSLLSSLEATLSFFFCRGYVICIVIRYIPLYRVISILFLSTYLQI